MSDREQRNENSETVADILAEMRAYAKHCREENFGVAPECEAHYNEYDVECLADRIETAVKREMAKVEADALAVGGIVEAARRREATAEKSSAVGNASAMREALVAVKKSIDGIGESSLDCDPIILMAALTQVCARLSSRIERALSAPARNCDRFVDETDAQIAFLNEVWLISVDRETMLARDKYENWSDEMRTRYGKWLLAPAAERKGEDDDA